MQTQDIPGGTSTEDRESLAALHSALAERGSVRYLEVGCYLGGTLQLFVADPRCEAITAIDRRDTVSRDVRGSVSYHHNTTSHMLELLAQVPGADLEKLEAIDAGTDDLHPTHYSANLCFIDAEHTDEAVLRDARFCRRVIRDRGVIAFHDRTLVARGIRRFLSELPGGHRVYPLEHDLLVAEIRIPTLLTNTGVRAHVPRSLWLTADRLRLVPLALRFTELVRREPPPCT